MADTKCHATFQSFYNKSSLYLLYGGMRKTLFVDPHPIGAITAKNVGLKVGKAFYDIQEREIEFKDSNWRVKANCSGNNLFNMKMKLGEKGKGVRNNVQFGRDSSHFGHDKNTNQFSIGGMGSVAVAGIMVNSRLKVFDEAIEVFSDAAVAGATLACDMRVAPNGQYRGFVGASYDLVQLSVPRLKNVHVGSVVSLPDMRPSVGLFAEAAVPSVQKAIVGVEFFQASRAVLVGCQMKIDDENSVVAKAGDNGIAHISFIKRFKGIDVRLGLEASVKDTSLGKFGAEVKLLQ